jgi:hypothetical protein
MKIIQRIGSDPALLELLLEMQEKHPGCFTDVWLNTAYGYPKNEDHAKVADELAEAAQRLREKGIRVSMQLSNTLGHGQYMMLRDCSGLVFEGSPVRKMVGHDGVQAEYAFCWNDPYFRNYLTEHVRDYMKNVVTDAREKGYTETLYGRRRWIPELKSSNFNIRSGAERIALNTPIQGTAADLIKLAMIRVDAALRQEFPEAKLILQVHDELIVECPEQSAQQVAALVSREMNRVAALDVPLTAEAKFGKSWYDAK